MPQLNPDWFAINPWLFVITAVIVVVFLVFAVIWGVRAHQGRVLAGREEMLGKTAVADTTLDPKGAVLIEGERWTAISEEGQIEPDEEVVVTRIQGLKLYVKKQSNKEVSR
ncbi:NfeD family protein [Chloroflexota bacterium]